MASRLFYPAEGALEARVVDLFCSITIGGTGTVSSFDGLGFADVTKESADGQYTLELQDSYPALLAATMTLLDDTDSNPASVGCLMRVQSEDVDASGGTPEIVIQAFTSDDGADANPASGAVLLVHLKLRNSTLRS